MGFKEEWNAFIQAEILDRGGYYDRTGIEPKLYELLATEIDRLRSRLDALEAGDKGAE